MRDLGTLGLGDSTAVAVDSGTVVGTAFSRTTDRQQPFAHDLAPSTIRAIGPLRYIDGSAVDVTGSVVGGTSFDSDEYYSSTAYVFDLGTSTRRDLPGLGPGSAPLGGLGGRDAAGTASVTGSPGPHLVTWDLSSATLAARDRGSLGGTSLVAADVRDGVVVGRAARVGDDRARPFATDLRSSRPWLTDLGTTSVARLVAPPSVPRSRADAVSVVRGRADVVDVADVAELAGAAGPARAAPTATVIVVRAASIRLTAMFIPPVRRRPIVTHGLPTVMSTRTQDGHPAPHVRQAAQRGSPTARASCRLSRRSSGRRCRLVQDPAG